MPRAGSTFSLTGANGHIQLLAGAGPSVQTLTLETTTNAVLLSARTSNAYVVFDGSTPSATNGLEIIQPAQPVLIPLGYMANASRNLKFISAAANGVLNVVQLT